MVSLAAAKRLKAKEVDTNQIAMRWKLILLTSLAAAIISVGLWSAVTIGIFGSARAMARSDAVLLSSLIIPLAVVAYGAIFVYRHTANRRKLQALITICLALALTAATYLLASTLSVKYLYIPTTSEVRHAR
jgi:hypothetical protein